MRLQELRQKLYSRQSDIESRKPRLDTYDPRSQSSSKAEATSKKDDKSGDWVIETNTTKKQKTLLVLILSILGGLALTSVMGYLIYLYKHKDFKQEQVIIAINLPSAVNINEDFSMTVDYANNNPLGAKNAKIILEFPSNYTPGSTKPQANTTNKNVVEWNLGDLAAQGDGLIEINGRFTSKEEDSVKFKSTLSYVPENFASEFKNEHSASTKVIGVPLSLNIESTRTVADNYAVNCQVRVRNNGKEPFQNLITKITYPDGFSFINSSPDLEGEGKSTWRIPTLLSNEEKILSIEGKINGKTGDRKLFTANLGIERETGFNVYLKRDAVTNITDPPVTISQESNNNKTVVHKKEEIPVTITYKNASERPINQAIVKVKLDGVIFDFKEGIKVDNGGWFDPNSNEVVWQGGATPELATIKPNSSGKLSFSFKVADFIPFVDNKKTNFTGITKASIESPEMPTPVGANKVVLSKNLEFKLSTLLGFETKALYSDGTLPNKGPLPPTVGEETTYTIHWDISNAFNDIRNVEVKTVLPPGVNWEDQVFPTKGGVTYKPGTREVIWNKDQIPAGAGNYFPTTSLVFQVSIKPTENDHGKTMDIFGESSIKATDTFTQETLTMKSTKKTTRLEDDATSTEYMGTVIKKGEELYGEYDINY